ncbi:hypothetical protein MSPP1_003395 [Malassezia sp. CBS 17886]|nr:hypothetical protein MSPP1_003395 [Malassezia sp. CBS 17886]
MDSDGMAGDTATANKVILHAATTDNVALMNSILLAEPPVSYDINATDGIGNTPLHNACLHGSPQVLDVILNEEVDMDLRNRLEGSTPLHLACKLENEELRNWIVTELLEAGASTKITNNFGQRPVDTVVGTNAQTPLGKQLIDLLTMSQAEAGLGTDDIANDDDGDDDGPPSDEGA